jgi:hypothetical protein
MKVVCQLWLLVMHLSREKNTKKKFISTTNVHAKRCAVLVTTANSAKL